MTTGRINQVLHQRVDLPLGRPTPLWKNRRGGDRNQKTKPPLTLRGLTEFGHKGIQSGGPGNLDTMPALPNKSLDRESGENRIGDKARQLSQADFFQASFL